MPWEFWLHRQQKWELSFTSIYIWWLRIYHVIRDNEYLITDPYVRYMEIVPIVHEFLSRAAINEMGLMVSEKKTLILSE